jgi:hypothetical protein
LKRNVYGALFCFGWSILQCLYAEEPSSFREQPCAESLSELNHMPTSLSMDQLDAVLKHYSLQRVHARHGLWVVDVNLESSEIPLAGHAVEVYLEIQRHSPFSSRYEILALKFPNGIVFGVSDRKTKKILEVILGRGFDEESAEAALFAQQLKGTEISNDVIFKMGE